MGCVHAVQSLWRRSVREPGGTFFEPCPHYQKEVPPNQARPPRGELDSPQSPEMGEGVLLGLISRGSLCNAFLGPMAIGLVGMAVGEEVVCPMLRIRDRNN